MIGRRSAVFSLLLAASILVCAAAWAVEGEGKAEFAVAFNPTRVTLDPLHIYTTMESQLATAFYEGLLTYNPISLEPVPGAASRWDTRENGRIYRFTIRADAFYSNGDPVKAQDFVASWFRIIDPREKAEYSFLFDVIRGAAAYRKGEQTDPGTVGIRAVSEKILEVELAKPSSHFLKLLCHVSFVPIHPSYLKRLGWESSMPLVGNGPFFISRKSGDEIILEKNRFYWEAKNVAMERIRIRFIEDPDQMSRGFLDGEIQWATNGNLELLKDASKISVFPMFATSYFFFCCDRSPWNDERVRRGLALLLPWDAIRDKQLLFATDRLVPSIPSYPEVKGIAMQDISAGLSLLKEAGFPQGKGLPALVIKVNKDSTSAELARKMAEAWERLISLEVVIREFEYEEYLVAVKERDYALGFFTWIGDYADPLTFLQMWITGSNLNDALFSDPEFDRLIGESLGDEQEARYKKLSQAETMLLSKAVVLPINHNPAVNIIDLKGVDGWYPNLLDIHPFKYLRFKEKKVPPRVALAGPGRSIRQGSASWISGL